MTAVTHLWDNNHPNSILQLKGEIHTKQKDMQVLHTTEGVPPSLYCYTWICCGPHHRFVSAVKTGVVVWPRWETADLDVHETSCLFPGRPIEQAKLAACAPKGFLWLARTHNGSIQQVASAVGSVM